MPNIALIPNTVETAIKAYYSDNETAALTSAGIQFTDTPGEIYVPQVEGNDIGPYDSAEGWAGSGVDGGSIDYMKVEPTHDDALVIRVDGYALRRASMANGKNFIGPLVEASLKKSAASLAAATMANIAKKVPVENRLNLSLDADNVIASLDKIEQAVFDAGYTGKNIITFARSDVKTALKTAMQKAGAAGNYHIIEEKLHTINRATNLDKIDNDTAATLEVVTDYSKYGKLNIVECVPTHMYTNVVRKQDLAGKFTGGFGADPEMSGSIKLLVIPEGAAWTAAVYSVQQILAPKSWVGELRAQLDECTQKTFNMVNFSEATVIENPNADALQINIRILYDGSIFDVNANSCFAVYEMYIPEKEAAPVTAKTSDDNVTVEFGGYFNQNISDFTINSSNKSAATAGAASIDAKSGVLVVPITPVGAGDTNITVSNGGKTLSTANVTIVSAS